MGDTAPTPSKSSSIFDLTPEQERKFALVFLTSLGVTLLLTGRSGGKLLKRAKQSEGSAAAAAPLAPAPVARSAAPPPPRPTHPPPRAPPVEVQLPPVSTQLPTPPPPSFLHPNSLTPPKPRRLLPSFVSSSSSISVLPSRPAPSAYFLPNPTLLAASTSFAERLDRLDKLHEEGSADLPPPIEDGFNPAVYAMKALGIATALTFGTFAAGVWGLMRYLEVDDLESLALALQHRLPPVLGDNRPSLPAWLLPSPKPADATSPGADPDASSEAQEELSYWASIKETLDREAEERKVERQGAWERMRKRAEELGGGKAATA
ncbi:hypothetical protein JCM10207_005868 [Rhodosporidiobolus poonsookiae]